MLEWIGVCCCSSFVSCICSLIATTFCLSPRGVSLRQSTSDLARSGKPRRLGKINPRIFDGKTSKVNRKITATSKSESSCECTLGKCRPGIRYRSSLRYSRDQDHRTSFPERTLAKSTSPIFLPCSKLCQSSFVQASQTPGDFTSINEVEMRKLIEEYDAVFKRFKNLIEDKTVDKKLPEAGVSVQNSFALIDTTSAFTSPSKKSDKTVGSCCEKSITEVKLIREIAENERSTLSPNYGNDYDYNQWKNSPLISRPVFQQRILEPPEAKSFLKNHGWPYRMKKNVRKVCEKIAMRGDVDKAYKFRSDKRTN